MSTGRICAIAITGVSFLDATEPWVFIVVVIGVAAHVVKPHVRLILLVLLVRTRVPETTYRWLIRREAEDWAGGERGQR